MFTAFGKLVSYLTSGPNAADSDNSACVSADEQTEENDMTIQRRQFDGKITHVFSSQGLIDNEVYFSFDSVIGDRRPCVGDGVSVVATQDHEGGGWHAEQVQVDTDWDNVNDATAACEPCRPAEVVGCVTDSDGDSGYINDSIRFSVAECKCEGFIPRKGDWVKSEVKYSEDDKTDISATTLKPLRVTETDGVISAFQGDHGYIDGEVYFTPDVCVDGYRPRKWEPVWYSAIESNQGRCTWRAVQVEPSRKPDTTSLKLLRGPMQKSFMSELLADKDGITITKETDFGSIAMGTKTSMTLWVRNQGNSPRTFVKCHLTAGSSQVEIKDVRLLSEHAAMMKNGGNEKVTGKIVLFPTMLPGQEKHLLIFTFEDFKIGRQVTASVRDSMQELVGPATPYSGGPRSAYRRYKETNTGGATSWLVPGERPNRFKRTIQYPDRLPRYEVPDNLRDAVLDHEDLLDRWPVLNEELCFDKYTERFKLLLHLEEIQMDIEIREFDLDRVCLRHVGEFMGLKVPGLAEGRPSVLLGDKIFLTDPCDPDGPCYEGYVHQILKDEVLLKFNKDFHSNYSGKDFNVVFTFNRGPIRKCHKAAEFATQLGDNVLFPTCLVPKLSQCSSVGRQPSPLKPVSGKSQHGKPDPYSALTFYNKSLNDRQKSAVTRILQGHGRPLPYILFGPPGTGKTVTVVEAILQIFTRLPRSRIITCAPSNSAADLLTQRIHESGLVQTGDLVRLNALQRSEEGIPGIIRPYCTVGDTVDLAARYRILVTTCVSAGVLYGLGIKAGHFTHVFVDEAGQATEPECLISASLVAGTDGQIILAGDPQQLGPVLRSSHARQHGLQVSLLERLIATPLYQRNEKMFVDHGAYDPLLVTKLVDNYRSHLAILQLPSRLFYHGELVERADTALTHTFCSWAGLPTPGVPVIFHGVRGEDLREGNSPSWFNAVETVQVVRYLQAVLNAGDIHISPDDVGIITPYRKQVEKVRLMIDRLGVTVVKVGSVEEFQGQERQVIIISTVRSNEAMVGFDERHTLGFLSNPKRFNVAITRAQALLIIVGNPHVLVQDQYWKALIDYCVACGGYTGCDLPPTSVVL